MKEKKPREGWHLCKKYSEVNRGDKVRPTRGIFEGVEMEVKTMGTGWLIATHPESGTPVTIDRLQSFEKFFVPKDKP